MTGKLPTLLEAVMTEPDHATPAVKTVGLSPKMIAPTVVTTVVGVVVALLNALQADASMLGGLNPVLQFIILTAIPPVLAGFAAYQASPGNISVSGR
jgi:hypothetical protein